MKTDLTEIVDFIHWFEEKARAEFPNLEIVTALYTEDGWPQCEEGLVRSLSERFPNATKDHFEDVRNGSGSGATTRWTFRDPENPEKETMVMKINLDQCSALADGDTVTGVKACVSHEMAHIMGSHKFATLGSLLEENRADVFEALMMSALGYEEHPEMLLERRIMSIQNPDKIHVSRNYGFPSVYEDAQDLIMSYRGVDLDQTSFTQILDEAEEFVEARREKLDSWFGFDDGIAAISHETKDDADILGAAAHAGSPLVPIISRVSGVEPNMDFKPAHEPNPFLSRRAAWDYPRPERDYDDNPPATTDHEADQPYAEYRGLVPEGFVIMYPDGQHDGSYQLDQVEISDEPPFS